MNDAINPVKLYMYALLGKPVVGTNVRELASRPQVVRVGRTAEEFAARVGEAVAASKDPAERERMTRFALANTWEHRAEVALKVIEGAVSRGAVTAAGALAAPAAGANA
jgi:hypothetical protein